MTAATYVIAAVMVGTFVVTWTLGRFIERLRDSLAAVSGLVVRAGLGLILALVAAQAAMHGGYWWIIVPILVLLALWNFALTAGMIWVWARDGLEDSNELPSGQR